MKHWGNIVVLNIHHQMHHQKWSQSLVEMLDPVDSHWKNTWHVTATVWRVASQLASSVFMWARRRKIDASTTMPSSSSSCTAVLTDFFAKAALLIFGRSLSDVATTNHPSGCDPRWPPSTSWRVCLSEAESKQQLPGGCGQKQQPRSQSVNRTQCGSFTRTTVWISSSLLGGCIVQTHKSRDVGWFGSLSFSAASFTELDSFK